MRWGRACLKGWVEPKGAKREDRGYSGTMLDGGGDAALAVVVAVVHEQRRECWHERETPCQVSSPRTRVALEVVKSVGDAADKLRR